MPKRSERDMEARREHILRAAAACFSRRGFQATTIADISKEAQVSAGGIYTHFRNKHEIVAAIGGRARDALDRGAALDLVALFDALQSEAGLDEARLDLSLWAESLHDEALRELVTAAMDDFRRVLKVSLPPGRRDAAMLALIEALSLGFEVQRALGRPTGKRLRHLLRGLVEGGL